jgi:excinuclease ABC subunit C
MGRSTPNGECRIFARGPARSILPEGKAKARVVAKFEEMEIEGRMSLVSLRQQVRTFAENRPGIYQMRGPADELLYVGKSVRVRSRVLSYFRAPPEQKAHRLIRETARLEWEYVPNEFSALVREMKLIQRWRPPFNVEHKRKRVYAFVKITNERAPRMIPVTRVLADDSVYFGPFPRVGQVGETVRELAQVIGLRDCPATTPVFFDDQLEFFEGGRLPMCMRADLGTCPAPCCGGTSSTDYAALVRMAHRFLEGKTRAPLAGLEDKMAEAASRMDFEYASVIRDRIEKLEKFQDQLAAFRGRVHGLTFLYRVPGYNGADRLYLIRRGRIRREFVYPRSRGTRVKVARAIGEVFAGVERGPAALQPFEAAEILLVARWFRLHPEQRKRTIEARAWLEQEGLVAEAGTRADTSLCT